MARRIIRAKLGPGHQRNRAGHLPQPGLRRGVIAYLCVEEVAQVLGVKVGTVRNYRCAGLLPDPDVVVGKSPGWKPATIEKWMKRRTGPRTAAAPVG